MRAATFARLGLSLLALPLASFQVAPRAPTAKEIDARVERCFALDPRSADGFAELQALLEGLAALPALDAKQEQGWREKLAKLGAKSGPRLEPDAGAHWFWPAAKKGGEGRGLYLVGGNTKRPKGLLVGLHGGGVGAGDAWEAHGALAAVAREFELVGIFPEVLAKTERGWTDSGTEEFVIDLVEAALRTWKLDRQRVYFSGHSMGGYGTWVLGAHHADLVAGLAPSAGAPTPILDASGAARDVDWGIVPNLRNVPIRIYQSDDDPNVPPEANRVAAAKLGEARARWGGFDFEYWEVHGRAHELPPGGMRALFGKLADAKRVARPEKVVWQPSLAWKRQFYWLQWDAPRKFALVVAELERAKNEVRVTCDGDPHGLSVLLDDELLDLERELVVTLDGREVFRGLPERSLATLVRSGLGGDPRLTFSARVPLAP